MKKQKRLYIALAAVLALSGGGAAFAADASGAPQEAASVEEASLSLDFTGTPISLSVKEAVKRVTSVGPGYETAVLARDALTAQAQSNADSWNEMRAASIALSTSGSPNAMKDPTTTASAKVVRIARPYLEEQAGIGFEIDMNNLTYNTEKSYHGALQADEALRIARDNEQIQRTILANTNRKFGLGMASKMDVLTAESGVRDAEINTSEAGRAAKLARMDLNRQLDLPLMQNVTLTDSLKMAAAPPLDLNKPVAAALATRNEFNAVRFAIESAKLTLEGLANESHYSGKYFDAVLALSKAEKQLKDLTLGVEIEIRSKYMALQNLSASITAIEKNVANAKEAYRLAELSYNAGMNTLTDVQNAQLASYSAQLKLSSKILEYNLALSDFEMSCGYGRGSGAGTN